MGTERKRASQTIRETPKDDYSLTYSMKTMGVVDATRALRLMLDGKNASMSAIARP